MRLSEATILVVDDEPALREIFARWLVALGCGKVCTAAEGNAALAMFETDPVDVLITDVSMPLMDGVTLVRRLAESGRSLPSIVFVSGLGNVDRREMYGLGVEAFLSKPFDRGELLDVLERALAERSALWLKPMDVLPRQSILLEGQGPGEDLRGTTIRLGRGGFSAHYAGALSLSKVAFQCRVPGKEPLLTGQGYVRWTSNVDRTVGIEFVFLDPPCRSWLLEEMATASPRSFIPTF